MGLQKMKLGENVSTEGPRVTQLAATKQRTGKFTVQMTFDQRGLTLRGTRNCTACCNGNMSDFDFSHDGQHWYNGEPAIISRAAGANVVSVDVRMTAAPTVARYTANQIFPQCAVYGSDGFPAYPFQHSIVYEHDAAGALSAIIV